MALHNVGESKDVMHRPFKPAFEQGAVETTLDEFLVLATDFFPTHMKIDVDGAEAQTVDGGRKTFADERLRSVLIELNDELECDRSLVPALESLGFPHWEKRQSERQQRGKFAFNFNYIFRRA